jgi:HEAT repeats
MDPKNKSSLIRTLAVSITALGCAGSLLWSGSTTRHVLARNPNNSASRPHKTMLRVSDSPDACRVVMTADQALNSYEAYRRGDRFYVRIPLSSLPAADTIRGQAFSDVRVEQTPGGTIISFRLHADATAHVDQRGNKIEIVFLVPRPRLALSATANRATLNSGGKRTAQNDANQIPKAVIGTKATNASSSKAALAARATPKPKGASTEGDNDQARLSESARTANAQKPNAASVNSALAITARNRTAKTASAEPNSAGVNIKPSASSWLSRPQMNRLTVGLGAGLLLSMFGLVFVKRRAAMVRTVPSEAMQYDETEDETVIPEATAMVPVSTSQELPPPAVNETAARKQTMGSAISKLVLDNTHRADVMNSRAPEDRKAIESSLLNIINAAETSDDECRRAREALEQYGFVAQHNATLLKGQDAWERSSAARALGTIGSKSSLPFLIEALNDSDSIVRNDAVASIAALKDPAAIGALVEASRKHPDLALSLLGETLNACSVDSVECTDSSSEVITTGQAHVPENDDSDLVKPDVMGDGIISGWLALVDDSNEGANTQDVTSVYMLPPVERRPLDGPYLRIVA